jgi:hypothetical protein
MQTVTLVTQELETQSLYGLTAVLTTLLSIAVYMMISTVSSRVSKPAQPVYAISR